MNSLIFLLIVEPKENIKIVSMCYSKLMIYVRTTFRLQYIYYMYNPVYIYNLYYFNYRYVIHTVNYLKYVAMKDSYLDILVY